MLVALSFGLPRQTTKLEAEARTIENTNGAQVGTVKVSAAYWRRKVVGRKEEVDGLAKLKDFQNEFKKKVAALAKYPYSGGFNIAPASVVEELLLLKRAYLVKHEDVWFDWAANDYTEWYDSAPARMGSLFKDDDFPDLPECQKMFTVKCDIIPLGEPDAVKRITLLSPHSAQLLEQSIDEGIKSVVGDLHHNLWNDLMGPIQKVIEVFEKDKPKVYETLLENLMTIVNVVPSYKQLTGDEKLMEAAAKAKAVFGAMTTEDLRASDEARKTALTTAREIVATFAPHQRRLS